MMAIHGTLPSSYINDPTYGGGTYVQATAQAQQALQLQQQAIDAQNRAAAISGIMGVGQMALMAPFAYNQAVQAGLIQGATKLPGVITPMAVPTGGEAAAGVPAVPGASIQGGGSWGSAPGSMAVPASSVDTAATTNAIGGFGDITAVDVLGDAGVGMAGGALASQFGGGDKTLKGIGGGALAGAIAGTYLFPGVGTLAGLALGAAGGWLGSGAKSGCFITTACCQVMGLADDCHVLTVLRKFRDTYMMDKHPDLVEEYYEVAPKIVKALADRPGRDRIYRAMYDAILLPAVKWIEQGDFEDACDLYRSAVETLKEITHVSEISHG